MEDCKIEYDTFESSHPVIWHFNSLTKKSTLVFDGRSRKFVIFENNIELIAAHVNEIIWKNIRPGDNLSIIFDF